MTERRKRGEGSIFRKRHGARLDATWTIQYYREGLRKDADGNLILDGAGRPIPARERVKEATGEVSRIKAQRLLTERLSQVSRGEYAEPQRHPATVEELLCALADHNRANGKDRDNGLRRRRRHLDSFFSGVVAGNLTTDLVTRYTLQRQSEDAANATINRELSTLRRALNLGKRATPPKVKTVPYISLLREDNTRMGFVEQADFDRLTAAASELWLRTFLEIAYTYGWRKGEILGLHVRNVNLQTRKIRLDVGTTKNKEGREVKMTDRVFGLVTACCASKKPTDHLLTRGKGQRPVHDMRDAWYALCVKAGLGRWETVGEKKVYAGLIPHDLRRSGAKAMRRAGVPESTIMTTGGWKTAAMFRRYAITSEADQSMVVELLERAQKANGPLSTPFPAETAHAERPGAEAKVQ
jgi:integrase